MSIGEESPRLMAHIAMSDGPWTDVVRPITRLRILFLRNLGPGTHRYRNDLIVKRGFKYTDSRPHLGVVSTNGIWWRYYTTPNIKSRARNAF